MKKYQIVVCTRESKHAGTKAPKDVSRIAEENGFCAIKLRADSFSENIFGKLLRQCGYCRDWLRASVEIEKSSILLLQHPFYRRDFARNVVIKFLKYIKKVRIIAFVHDVEELRKSLYNSNLQREFKNMVRMSDVMIVHNEVMKAWFVHKGIPESKLVTLGIFDYLIDSCFSINKKTYGGVVSFAGCLDRTKSGFVYELESIENVSFDLYGPDFDRNSKIRNAKFLGEFAPEALSEKIHSGFGLVWDGPSLMECEGNTGNYLRYNNPHKLSLYISLGLPVIVWSKSACASFVAENNIGIHVNSLLELSDKLKLVSEAQYNLMAERSFALGCRLRHGEFTKAALARAVEKITIGHRSDI